MPPPPSPEHHVPLLCGIFIAAIIWLTSDPHLQTVGLLKVGPRLCLLVVVFQHPPGLVAHNKNIKSNHEYCVAFAMCQTLFLKIRV